jgi:hypothetical protein
MHKFDLEDGMFYSYNNKTISSNQSWSLINISENSLLRIVAWNIYKNNKKQKLSLSSRINRFFTHSKWADKHFTSNNGKINDTNFFIDEIVYHLSKLTDLTYLSSSEFRDLLICGIRIYFKDGTNTGIHLNQEDLYRCVNLQEFHSNEFEINFDFAENLKNLRIVDLFVNNSTMTYGKYNKSETNKRKVLNIEKLKACKVLHLEDSYINDFSKIPNNVYTLSLRNSNFENPQNLTHLNKLEYLDISFTNLTSIDGLSELQSIRILNLYCIKINETKDLVTIYHEILKLNNLEILIIDKDNLNLILESNPINIEIKNKILELEDGYIRGHLTSIDICEILKIAQRVKIEFNDSKYDFWNSPLGKEREYQTSDVEIDFEKIKINFREKLIFKPFTKSKNEI